MDSVTKLINHLEKCFYVEHANFINKIWVYSNKGDSEPLFTLTDSAWYEGTEQQDTWIIGNFTSTLEDGRVISTDELIDLAETITSF
jgi:hypothetical protein